MTTRPPPPAKWFIALTTGSAVMSLTLLTPALPQVQKDFLASSNAVQQLLSYYLVALALGQLVYGTLSDRIGRRPVLLFGALLFGLAGLAAALAQSIEALTFYRVVQGLGAAACMAIGRAMVNDCFERAEAAKYLSVIAVMMALVPGLSLSFGGVLAESSGWRGSMWVTFAVGLGVFLIALLKLSETNLQRNNDPFSFKALLGIYHQVLRNRLFVLFALTSGMQVGMFFTLNGILPFQYERLGYTATEFGLWFSLTPLFYLLGNAANSYYFVSRGIEKAALLGSALTLLSVVAMYFTQAMGMSHALSLAIPCALFGFSNGIVVVNTTVGAMSASGEHAGTGTGLVGAWQMIASGIAGALIVAIGGAVDFNLGAMGLLIMSVISVSSMILIARVR